MLFRIFIVSLTLLIIFTLSGCESLQGTECQSFNVNCYLEILDADGESILDPVNDDIFHLRNLPNILTVSPTKTSGSLAHIPLTRMDKPLMV